MSQLLLENIDTDKTDADPKLVRGPCAVLLEGTIGSATVTIKVGREGGTRQAVAFFDADDDDTTLWDNGRGRLRTIDVPGAYYIEAEVLGSGDHNVSVALLN